jgi:hypothetical protein
MQTDIGKGIETSKCTHIPLELCWMWKDQKMLRWMNVRWPRCGVDVVRSWFDSMMMPDWQEA